MTLRKFLFWCHLTAGVVAGVVIAIMSVTGALLAYERQIVAWADTRHLQVVPPAPPAPRLPLEGILANLGQGEPRAPFTNVTVRADPTAPLGVQSGQRMTYIDPYTGRVIGEGSAGVRRFFRVVTDWHRTLAFAGEQRAIGRAVTGASNLAFLFIVASGIVLWWPRTWTRRQVKAVTFFNGGLRGKARDFNWHNVIGFWSAIPLFVIVLGSVVISYPWASDLVYRIAGEAPPPRPSGPSGGANAPAQGPNGEAARRRSGGRGNGGGREAGQNAAAGIDTLWARAEQQVPGWRSISFRVPPSAEAPVAFTIDEGTGGQPQKRGTLTLGRPGGEIVKWEPFASLSAGRQLRSWLRFVHTGEFYGIAGQTVAGAVSLGGAVLMYTGFALALRRLLAWRVRARGGFAYLASAFRGTATVRLKPDTTYETPDR